jgi:hypothetical protein
MRRSEKFDSFDTNVGKYSSRKVPKWNYNNSDVIEYLNSIEEEGFTTPELMQLRPLA